jgi:hypothetical protein
MLQRLLDPALFITTNLECAIRQDRGNAPQPPRAPPAPPSPSHAQPEAHPRSAHESLYGSWVWELAQLEASLASLENGVAA